MTTTEATTPPTKVSEEAKAHQHRMAQDQGQAYVTALHHMANTVADDGGEKPAGEYVVAYAVEKAEGMWKMSGGELHWQEPDDANVHIEISVRDGADDRFVPGLEVYVTVVAPDDTEVGTEQQPMLWHPWLYHYGRNWQVPGDGEYTLRVRIEAPDFPRHDPQNGRRYAEPVEVEFTGVKFKTG